MCGYCVSGVPLEQLRQAIKAPQYSTYNTIKIQQIMLSISAEKEGTERRDLALAVLRGFIEWRRTQPEKYVPETGLETMYTVGELQETYDYLATHIRGDDDAAYNAELDAMYEALATKYPRPEFVAPKINNATNSDFMSSFQEELAQKIEGDGRVKSKVVAYAVRHPQTYLSFFVGTIFGVGVLTGVGGTLLIQYFRSSA